MTVSANNTKNDDFNRGKVILLFTNLNDSTKNLATEHTATNINQFSVNGGIVSVWRYS